MIEAAKRGGAHCAKFQAYKADLIAAVDSPAYWDRTVGPQDETQYALFAKHDAFGPEEFEALADHCAKIGIDFACTAFDLAAVDMVDPLVSFHKIASADVTNVPLLRAVAAKRKPVLLSTGAATMAEITLAVRELIRHGAPNVILLHCMLSYPTRIEDANLLMIRALMDSFPECLVGYSDHTLPEGSLRTLYAAALMGAVVLEKHFTDNKTLPGNDHFHAMDEGDLHAFRREINWIWPMLGNAEGRYSDTPFACEAPARLHARRSIYAASDIPLGKVIEPGDLICLRPGGGIGPEHWDLVVGAHATRAFKAGERIDQVMVERAAA
jgi:sialic acid synthase SpsE